jgi:hypothetical protein
MRDLKILIFLLIFFGCLQWCVANSFAMLRIRDVYPGPRIPDPKTSTKERGEKIFVVIPFFVATNFTKLKIILFLKF